MNGHCESIISGHIFRSLNPESTVQVSMTLRQDWMFSRELKDFLQLQLQLALYLTAGLCYFSKTN